MPSQATIEAEAQRLLDEAKRKLRLLAQQPSGERALLASEKLDTDALRLKTRWLSDRLDLEIKHSDRIKEEIEREQIVEIDKRYLEGVQNAINDTFARLG